MHTNFHPIFQFPHLRRDLDSSDQFLVTYLTELEKFAAVDTVKKKMFSLIPDKVVYSLFNSSSDILFLAHRFPDLINAKKVYRMKLLSATSFSLFAKKKYNISNFPLYFFVKKVLFLYQTDPLLKSRKTKKFISETVKWLQSTSITYLIVSNDWLFVERFLIYCAKQANIKSICIQDGIFAKNSFTKAFTPYADYMFAWDTAQAELIKVRGFSNEQMKILGYPHNVESAQKRFKVNKQKICILGQPYENYYLNLGSKKKDLFSKLIEFLDGPFETVIYKPHPGEKNMLYIPDGAEIFIGSLADAIEQFDIFISISSTALLEATLADKIAIQIFDKSFNCDNLQEAGYSYSIESKKMKDIVPYILSMDSSFLPFCTMPVHENISLRFIELIKGLK